MTVSRTVAKSLCTRDEFALAEESFAPTVTKLTAKDIRARIQRARKLRDKYRDQAEKQAREILGRAAPTNSRTATNNRATVTKQQFFAESLARFEKRLEKITQIEERKSLRDMAKAALAKKKAADKRKNHPKSGKTRGKGPKSVTNDKVEQFPNLPAMRGAAVANNARSQARRDNKR